MKLSEQELKNIGNWLIDGERGSSSISLCAVALGGESKFLDYPHDAGDFNRCMNFLKRLKYKNKHKLIIKMAELSPEWARINSAFSEIEEAWKEECVIYWKCAPKLGKIIESLKL